MTRIPPVHCFEWDEDNAEHLARHGITDLEVDQLLTNRHLVVPSKKGSGSTSRMFLIGETNGGRILTVVISPTWLEGTWRPVTAFDANQAERARLRRAGS